MRTLVRKNTQKIDCGAWLKAKTGGRLIYWYPNPGNAGDHLIAAATDLLFRKNGIAFTVINNEESFDSSGKVVCYGGGGNFVPNYRQARNFVIRHHENAACLIILPHTIDGNEDVLLALDSNTTIICRDTTSFDHCQAASPKAEVLLADDLALSLDYDGLLNWRIIPFAIADVKTYLFMRQIFRRFDQETRGCNELEVWRSDSERHPARVFEANHDISRMFALNRGAHKLDQFKLSASFFLRAIDRFSRVRTDRLHVAIGAALLGKTVELYSNSYFKNRAVYELSLASLANVTFIDLSEVQRH